MLISLSHNIQTNKQQCCSLSMNICYSKYFGLILSPAKSYALNSYHMIQSRHDLFPLEVIHRSVFSTADSILVAFVLAKVSQRTTFTFPPVFKTAAAFIN